MKRQMIHILIASLLTLLLGVGPLWGEEPDRGEEAAPPKAAEPTAAPPAAVSAAPAGLVPSHSLDGFFSVGTLYSDLTGTQLRVSEYAPALQGFRPTSRLGLWGYQDGLAYDLSGELGADATDQRYELSIDARRYWKSRLSISKLPHRLINDPLTNLDTGKGPVIVSHDNFDEGINYCPAYQNVEWKNRLRLPFLPLVTLHLDYRNQSRQGSYDARTLSKCSGCHVVSEARSMDRETEEIRAGFDVGTRRVRLEYEFLRRELREHASTPTLVYDEVRHPALLTRVFTNRTQFDSRYGALPYNQIPDFNKQRHLLRGSLEMPGQGGQFVATFLKDSLENQGIAYGVDSIVASGYYAAKLGRRLHLTLQARHLGMDSDRRFVDVNEQVADGGPQKGKTYFEAYPAYGEADFWERSALERDRFDFAANLRVQLPARSSLRAGYRFEKLERPNFEVDQTKTSRVQLGFNTAPASSFKARARYEYAHSDTPFVNVRAALPTALQPYPTPGLSPFPGTQYFSVYRSRQADLSNVPKDAHGFVGSATWSPTHRVALTAHLRANANSHDGLNSFGTWKDRDVSPAVELWLAPSDRVDLLASYALHHRRTQTVFGVAVYDG